MARKIIINKRIDVNGYFEVSYYFWLSVPVARQTFYANANLVSAAPFVTAGELISIQTGLVIEQSGVASFPIGTSTGAVGAALVTKFNAAQATLNAISDFSYFGSYWDGTSWTVTGN